ncbi:MAG: radical SAM protein [Candidatus Omnitrophica bacterium]|nr:radical SAM protein [Candidatus Omnitrophota bacterium]
MVDGNNETGILLVQSPPWGVYAPPLGIAYLSAFLRSGRPGAMIYDLNMEIFRGCPERIRAKWDTGDFEFWASGKAAQELRGSLDGLAEGIISYGASVIGFSATFASAPFLNAFIPMLRKKSDRKLTIIVGGGGASYAQTRSLFTDGTIDYFVIGEGERVLSDLLAEIRGGGFNSAPAGCISWKDVSGSHAVCIAADKNNTDINTIPFPTFEEFDLSYYTQDDLIPLITSRGCIRNCIFCCDSPLKRPYRCRRPRAVADEMAYHVKRYKRKRFEFSDLLINGDLGFLDELCDCLIAMDMGVAWGGQATIRRDMGRGLLGKMKAAGCGGLTFGVESCSDRVLELIGKGVSAADIRRGLARAKDSGMQVEINLIVGFPGEAEEDIDETIDFIRKNAPSIDKINSLNICTIGPGTHIYEHLQDYNIDKDMITDWYAWFTRDMSNTLEVRMARHRRILSLCSELNLAPAWQNVKKSDV